MDNQKFFRTKWLYDPDESGIFFTPSDQTWKTSTWISFPLRPCDSPLNQQIRLAISDFLLGLFSYSTPTPLLSFVQSNRVLMMQSIRIDCKQRLNLQKTRKKVCDCDPTFNRLVRNRSPRDDMFDLYRAKGNHGFTRLDFSMGAIACCVFWIRKWNKRTFWEQASCIFFGVRESNGTSCYIR